MLIYPETYSDIHISRNSISPVWSKKTEELLDDVLHGRYNCDFRDEMYNPKFFEKALTKDVFNAFKRTFLDQINSSKYNSFKNLEKCKFVDITLGCTQYIDNLYILHGKQNIQVLQGEYKYHQRMYVNGTEASIVTPETLIPGKHLIISYPFASMGKPYPDIYSLFEKCLQFNIPVHMDCAWATACRDLEFDFSHPAVHTVGFSMSKGYGTSFTRIGIRLSKDKPQDSLSVQNDYGILIGPAVAIGNHFLKHINMDHMWDVHGDNYYRICKDFNLQPTNGIQAALKEIDGELVTVGVNPLLRFLEHNPNYIQEN